MIATFCSRSRNSSGSSQIASRIRFSNALRSIRNSPGDIPAPRTNKVAVPRTDGNRVELPVVRVGWIVTECVLVAELLRDLVEDLLKRAVPAAKHILIHRIGPGAAVGGECFEDIHVDSIASSETGAAGADEARCWSVTE